MSELDIVKKYFPELTDDQLDKVLLYSKLLAEWNEKINVISRKDIENVLTHHILPCVAINKAYKFEKKSSVLDIGTGGGLPGIPLAITNPDVDFHLIDSIGKKITVVRDIVEKLQLSNVTADAVRSDEIKKKYNYVVGRSVKNFPEFLNFATKNLRFGGKVLYLTGIEPALDAKEIFNVKIHDLFALCNQGLCESKVLIEISVEDLINKR